MSTRLPFVAHRAAVALLLLLLVVAVDRTSASEQPSLSLPEPDVLVSEFMHWDADFYRDHTSVPGILGLHRPDDQAAIYEREIAFDAPYTALDLDSFLALSPDEQAARRREARRAAVRVSRFALLIRNYRLEQAEGRIPQLATISGVKTVLACLHALINATGLDPANPWNWHLLSYFAGLLGDQDRCLAALDAAVDALSQYPNQDYREIRHRIALDYAWVYRDQGHWDKSREWLRRAATLLPGQPETVLLNALTLAGMGRQSDAHRAARKVQLPVTRLLFDPSNQRWIWQQVPSSYVENWVQALNFARLGDHDKALFALRRINADRCYAFGSRFWNDAGRVFELAGDKQQARTYYAYALATRPLVEYYVYEIGAGLDCTVGNPAKGLPYFLGYGRFYLCGSRFAYAVNKAVAMDSSTDLPHRQQLGREAITLLGECRRTAQHADRALALRGIIHFLNDDLRQADRDLGQVLAKLDTEGDATAALYLIAGVTRIQLDNPRGGLDYLRRATELDPQLALAWRTRAVAQIGAGDLAAGRTSLDRALDIDATAPGGWLNRGLLNFQEGRIDDAVADLERAAALAPQNLQVAAMLRRAEGVQQRLAGAGEEHLATTGETSLAYLVDAESTALLLAHASMDRSRSLPDYPSEVLAPATFSVAEIVRLEEAYHADPIPKNRRLLAQALIRSGNHELGRDMLLPHWSSDDALVDRCLILEADRALGETARALALVEDLEQGRPVLESAYLWSLVAFICLEHDHAIAGRRALRKAIVLDPDNSALQLQLQLIRG